MVCRNYFLRRIALVLGLSSLTSLSLAAPVVDGEITAADGYETLFIQNVRTQFGNCLDPAPDTCAGGSEIDGIYGKIDNGTLYMIVTGNLQNNFNKLQFFIDSVAGGQNKIDSVTNDLPEIDGFVDGDGDNGVGALQRMNGFQLDAGFLADYLLAFTNGTEKTSGGSNGWILTAHFGDVKPIADGGKAYSLGGNTSPLVVGGTLIDASTANTSADPLEQFFIDRDTHNTIGLRATIDNSNVDGVGGGNQLLTPEERQQAADVTTGIEFALPLAAIGNPTGDIKLSVAINGTGFDFFSNQFSGGFLTNFGNLAGPSTVNLANIDGDQFVVLKQTPSLLCDLNQDGAADAADAGIMFGNWGGSGAGDCNQDGIVDAADAGVLFAEWTGDAGPVSVPEPATCGLMGIGLALALRARKS